MIKRIVMMELLPGKEPQFLDIFNRHKSDIRAQEGCMGLEVLRCEDRGIVTVWTISHWESEVFLEQYRTSALFQDLWPQVKLLFSGKARAWTLTRIETIS